MITISNWLRITSKQLKNISLSPLLDAEIILAHYLKLNREKLILLNKQLLTKNQIKKLNRLVSLRQSGLPIAYITQSKHFNGYDFFVNKNVLIPRPDSETLVELSKQIILNKNNVIVVELGIGSGAILISLLKSVKLKNKSYGLDISRKALSVCKKNIVNHKLSSKILLKKSYLLNNWPKLKTIDLLIANLPYLPDKYQLKSKASFGLQFEPKISLFAGKDGLDLYRQLSQQIKNFQVNNLLIEILPQQINKAVAIFANKQYSCQIKNDLGGQKRFLHIYKNS